MLAQVAVHMALIAHQLTTDALTSYLLHTTSLASQQDTAADVRTIQRRRQKGGIMMQRML